LKLCLNCNKPIKPRNKFCNSHCAASYNNRIRSIHKKIKYCLKCGLELKSGQYKFCSSQCKRDYDYDTYISRWKQRLESGTQPSLWGGVSKYVRRYLFEKHENKCSKCQWGEINIYTNSIPLEIEHIDGNYQNNYEENLTLLCPNCHSLTSTYRGANRGKGRPITWHPNVMG
jgi:hypothetical protein